MKKFLKENWYKLMIGSSMLIASLGFLIQSVTLSYAGRPNEIISNSNSLTPGEIYVAGCGISDGYVYLVDFKVNGRNKYYKIPLDKFKLSNDNGE